MRCLPLVRALWQAEATAKSVRTSRAHAGTQARRCRCQPRLATQVAAVDAANAERDAYKLSAQEIQERSKVGRSNMRFFPEI